MARDTVYRRKTPTGAVNAVKDMVKDKGIGPRSAYPLMSFKELPEWMQDSRYIRTGYRQETRSYWECAKTVFGQPHNESVNIWSHLIGFIIFAVFCLQTTLAASSLFDIVPTALFSTPPRILSAPLIFGLGAKATLPITIEDLVVFYAFLLGGMACLGLSASYHCFHCHSEPVSAAWNRCDYAGIVLLITGSFYPAAYYGFYCHRVWQGVYIFGITGIGLATLCTVTLKRFRTPAFRWIRTGLFLAMGLSGIIPVLHGVFLYGFDGAEKAFSFYYITSHGALYVIGALIYGFRVPEKWYPGHFDIWFSSHQIFHWCVLAAALIHYRGVILAMGHWHMPENSCSLGGGVE